MSLSSCDDDEFTCDDGSCINMSLKCDASVDCEDGSDEKDCKIIVPDIGYQKHLTPVPGKGSNLHVFNSNLLFRSTFKSQVFL